MSLSVIGIGTAVPPHSIAQPKAAELAKAFCCRTEEQARLLPVLYERTRVDRRGSVLLDGTNGSGLRQSFFPPLVGETDLGPTTEQRMQRYAREAPGLALSAAQRAIAESHLTAAHLDHLITVSCTGFVAPGADIALIKGLGLPSTISRTHIGFMGCHGAFNGLRIASALVDAQPQARVLLCAVELCSLHFRYGWDPGQVVANALFADGAAAIIAVAASQSTAKEWQVAASGSNLFPDSEEAMAWTVGDHGFEMKLSARVPALLGSHLRPWLERWLGQNGLALQEIRSWAIHPGGPRILNTVAACLQLSDEETAASREILAEYGNMSSPTILFILERLRRQGAPRPCVALGFGPGLAAEAILFA